MSTVVDYQQANPAQRALRRFGATRPGSWLFAHLLRRLDRPVYRVTRGRHTAEPWRGPARMADLRPP